ncbi:MAG: cupin domain-containing protein [Bacteroidia bacterium]
MDLKTFISSGILESYVMGLASETEVMMVLDLSDRYPEVKKELEKIGLALEKYAKDHAVPAPPSAKAHLIEWVDSQPDHPVFPTLSAEKSIRVWHKFTATLSPPPDYENLHLSRLDQEAEIETYVVWAKKGIPPETHSDTLESFLVLEGNCTCYIGETITHMSPGDFMEIPLHIEHFVEVTSVIPLKVILQKKRAA